MIKNHWFIKMWDEKKYFDLWSLNHLISGIMLAVILFRLNFSFTIALLISIALMVSWEMFEIKIKIIETIQNRSTDILMGVLGFLLVYFSNSFFLDNESLIIGILMSAIVLNVWGFVAYHFEQKI